MTHERPCCGIGCTCDNEDTWNDPDVCREADAACSNCGGIDPQENDDDSNGVQQAPPMDDEDRAVIESLAAEESANNIRLAQHNKGTCPILTCRARVGETKEGRWFHLTGPDAGGRACFDQGPQEDKGRGT